MNYASEYTMLKKVGNIRLSQEEIDILDEYGINYRNVKNLRELIFNIERINIYDDVIQNVLDILQERDYYENYKK